MFEIGVTINNVDYSSVIAKLLPIVIERLGKSSSLGQTVSKFKSMPVVMAKAAISILPKDTQNTLAVYFFSEFRDSIAGKFNDFAKSEQIGVGFKSIGMEKGADGAAINLTIQIDELDYEALAIKAFPMIANTLERKLASDLALQLIALLRRVSPKTFIAFLRSVPLDVNDDLTVLFLSAYDGKIISVLNKFAEDESISLEVGKVVVRKLDTRGM